MIKTIPLPAARLRYFSRLTDKKFRSKEGVFLIEGLRAVSQSLLHHKIDTMAVVFEEHTDLDTDIIHQHIPNETPVYIADNKSYTKITATENSQGVVAICSIPDPVTLDSLLFSSSSFILALDGIQDPGNLGTIYRTAAWFGADAVLLGEGCVDLFNPKTIRSTAGSVGTVPYVNVNLEQSLIKLHENGWQTLSLELNDKAASLFEVKPEFPCVLVVGNEAHGVSESIKDLTTPIFLPGNTDQVESLNASVAAAVAMSFFYQQIPKI